MEGKAGKAQRYYYRLRLVTIVGAVVVPALVALNTLNGWPGTAAQIATWIVSLVVAVSAAVEGFFQFGQRWRNYRSTAERLKTEGWLFFQLAGPYAADASHADAFRTFASRVEDLIQKDVDVYITEVAAEKQRTSDGA
jgi:phosphate/sulfate permease